MKISIQEWVQLREYNRMHGWICGSTFFVRGNPTTHQFFMQVTKESYREKDLIGDTEIPFVPVTLEVLWEKGDSAVVFSKVHDWSFPSTRDRFIPVGNIPRTAFLKLIVMINAAGRCVHAIPPEPRFVHNDLPLRPSPVQVPTSASLDRLFVGFLQRH